MIDLRFVPITKWPSAERTTTRKPAPFGVKYVKLLDDLERELKHLRARDIVVQAFVSRDDIRNDGWPRSGARFNDPGVILSFKNQQGGISFPCDTYNAWDSNLRAISLTLTALRAIDRYGVSKHAEQYRGWKQIAAPGKENVRDATWALGHLANLAGVSVSAIQGDNARAMEQAYRKAATKVHPDTGGSLDAFQLLQEAMEILRVGYGGERTQ